MRAEAVETSTGTREATSAPAGAPAAEAPPRSVRVVLVDDDALVRAALRAGAAGFLLKDSTPERILSAVLDAAGGERPFSGVVLDRLVETAVERAPRRRPVPETLTARAAGGGPGRPRPGQ